MMQKLFTAILLLALSSLASAQSYSPLYSQYMENGLAINPAYAGSRESFSNTLLYRNQWMGFDGAPKTQTLSSHAPLLNDKVALGLLVMHEEIGVTDNYELYTNYAFRFRLGEGKLALGLRAGTSWKQSNWNEINTSSDLEDDAFSQANAERVFMPNAGVGIFFYNSFMFTGVSVPAMLSYKEKDGGGAYEMYHDLNNYDIFGTLGFFIRTSRQLQLNPSAMVRYRSGANLQVDANLNFIIMNALWIGASYRMDNEFGALVAYQINEQLRLGYAYDYMSGEMQQFNNGSHEILLRYEFKYKVRAESPRFF
mgnify:CR=1 FL=1